jgi:predicted dehydrogenase/threonine dehydrogenase-like Zn-dependent dehydrogenase
MKQILQNLGTGETTVAEVPCPALSRGSLLVRTTRSLVSAGTERMLVDFGKANLLAKARQQPDKVKMVLEKVKTDGLATTIDAVRNKLNQPLALGYCAVGRVMETGEGVTGFEVGDRVATNGNHAEVVAVPVNLSARVPDNVDDESASFTVLAAIGLQGLRLVQPTLGETIVVSGLGLIGLVTVQLLRANGCRVIGLDFNKDRLKLGQQFGAEVIDLSSGGDPVDAAQRLTRGQGVDAVIITASTKSSEPVHQAALMCRKRGRIVLVGVTGLELSRADFYEKELTFQVSCSYGPGRYEPNYELKGLDYPIGFVRWTEQRNFEAILDMLADGRLDVKPLITHRFAIADAERAYEVVGGSEPSLGVVLTYPDAAEQTDLDVRRRTVAFKSTPAVVTKARNGPASIAVIGAGNYATGVLIPAFKAAGVRLRTVASSAGVSGYHAARKFNFEDTTTDIEKILSDAAVDAVAITTRHNTHARFAIQAIEAAKHVFVEKPLALTHEEIDAIELARDRAIESGFTPHIMVGFNRRFAPHVLKMKELLAGQTAPKAMVMMVNAGALPSDHWAQDREVGGGRILGEACHFIDLLRFVAGAPIVSHSTTPMDTPQADTTTITLQFADGSTGAIHYFANGDKSFPKERLEVFVAGRVLQLENFRKLSGWGWPGFRPMKGWRQDKGQKACAARFAEIVASGGPSPIPIEEIFEVSRATIDIDLANTAALSKQTKQRSSARK